MISNSITGNHGIVGGYSGLLAGKGKKFTTLVSQLLLLAYFSISAQSVLALSTDLRDQIPQYIEHSRHAIASKGGVDPNVLAEFYSQLQNEQKSMAVSGPPLSGTESVDCFGTFDHHEASRNAALICLKQFGLAGLNEKLFSRVFDLKIELMRQKTTLLGNQSIVLLSWLEDLTREYLASTRSDTGPNPRDYNWYVREKGFVNIKTHHEFDYQDGDIVLMLGNSSTSALISQATDPRRRFSHALMIRREKNGKKFTLESLIETGVKKFRYSHFRHTADNHFTVLRWKNREERVAIAERASEIALDAARREVGYDVTMNPNDASKIFCSELLAYAYAKAANEITGTDLDFSDIVPMMSRVRGNPSLMKHFRRLGVENEEIPSPGDLLASPYFEVVADYRPANSLFHVWELLAFGDLLVEQLSSGKSVDRGIFIFLIRWLDFMSWLPRVFVDDFRVIPKNVSAEAAEVLVAQVIGVSMPAFKNLDNEMHLTTKTKKRLRQSGHSNRRPKVRFSTNRRRVIERNLFSMSPWEMRGILNFYLDHDPGIKGYLHH